MSSSLSVPHFPQQADGYCLPACVQMVMVVNTMHFPHWQLQTAHAVVITDMGEAEVLMNDPGVEHGPISVSFGDFYLAWDEMANLYGLIRKK